MPDLKYKDINQLHFCIQQVLNLVYTDELSLYEVVGKCIEILNDVISNQSIDHSQILQNVTNIQSLQHDVSILQKEWEKMKNGDYMSIYIDALANWIDKNIQELVGRIVNYVVFGLTQDGNFCAWIPQTWSFLKFDTIVDPNSELYGHLLLRW